MRTKYNSCKANLGGVGKPVNILVEEETGQLFDRINRGDIIHPSNQLFNVTHYAYLIINVCICSVECTFLEVAHQKQTFWELLNTVLLNMCEECKELFIVCIMKGISCFPNVNMLS